MAATISNRKRRAKREALLVYLYQLIYNVEIESDINHAPSIETSDAAKSIIQAKEILTKKIQTIVFNWESLHVIEQLILIIGAYEILNTRESNPVFTINECIMLSKKYGSQDGYKLVNKVLDKFRLEIASPL
ncbi:MAG: transcription antitermination factor NusB [Methylacidiphilales bacterium]|nr:transcription antitermination factor NusB [Candidatus Methylacidiphilales bacterium]